MGIIEILGRFHPVILHIPIGILVLAFLMEYLSRRERYKMLEPAVGFALQIGMWSSILAAFSGYILSLEGGYDDSGLRLHQWLGIGTTIVSIGLYMLYQRQHVALLKRLYFPSFVVLMILLAITGHFGGSLTHGTDFLTAPLSESADEGTNRSVTLKDALIYQDLIRPIFQQKCTSCHNPSKMKGKLLMTSPEGITKGGETGAFLIPGDAVNSLFLEYIHLPENDEDHMPPKGKKQLTQQEITLLEWWVEKGASFDEGIVAFEPTEAVQSILEKRFPDKADIFSLVLEPASKEEITKLREQGINVQSIAEGLPFLSVNLSQRQTLSKKSFQQLHSISEQLIELNVSHSNMSDALLSSLGAFPHLSKLYLQHTNISDEGISVLENMDYLYYLNVYNTALGDESVDVVSRIPHLKKVFLWETNITKNGINRLQQERSDLQISSGVPVDIFGKSTLNAPSILVQDELFKDSTMVEIETGIKAGHIYYTLDGSRPDSSSTLYSEPIGISKGVEIQAIVVKEGWNESAISSKTVVKAGYQIKGIKLNQAPNEKYRADGALTLVDFKKGSTDFSDGQWIAYQGKSFSAVLDLEKESPISSVSVGGLEDTNSWIFLPKGLEVSLSNDGQVFEKIQSLDIPISKELQAAYTKNFTVTLDRTSMARYIKVDILSNLKNPAWHPNAGEPCWVFIDEIMVE